MRRDSLLAAALLLTLARANHSHSFLHFLTLLVMFNSAVNAQFQKTVQKASLRELLVRLR